MLLGIDGGGTRCRARLVNESGALLGEGATGPANLTLGVATAAASIRIAARLAFEDAGLAYGNLMARTRAGFGLAGANVPSLAKDVRSTACGFASVMVASDAVAACPSAHGGQDGAVLSSVRDRKDSPS